MNKLFLVRFSIVFQRDVCLLTLIIMLTAFTSDGIANQQSTSQENTILAPDLVDSSKSAITLVPSTDATDDPMRYRYQVSLSGFTTDEVNIVSGIALSGIDNVKASLVSEKTSLHFIGLLLPTIDVTYNVSTLVSPSQFRHQMTRLFERMNVEAYSKFVPQENTFFISRAFTPYTTELIALWATVVGCIYFGFLVVFWNWIQYKLNLYRSLNQASKWVKCLLSIRTLPLPFLIRQKWTRQLPYWEKRVSQADIWLDNANQLVLNHEIESANVFVKKSLEENASNIPAQALETAISQKLSKHQVIDDEREKWKGLVTKAVEYAQQGNTLAALEKAYTALALCEENAKYNRPVIDLQIESVKNLVKRISLNKSLICDGLKLHSINQKIQINATSILHIGRGAMAANQQKSTEEKTKPRVNAIQKDQHLHVLFAQDTLSRIGRSIAIVRQDNGFIVQDLGSTNGLWLQYKRCEKDSDYVLSDMDQLHLSPPNEIGTIGFQVRHIDSNNSIAFTLCQNAILPSTNLSAAKSFINPSQYANHRWYLSQEDFYLVFSLGQFIWYSASEWQYIRSQKEPSSSADEILTIQFKDQVWLYLTSSNYKVTIDGCDIIGPVPLPEKSQLRVNDTSIDIELMLSDETPDNETLIDTAHIETPLADASEAQTAKRSGRAMDSKND
jgi:pSer/pThr/pTyr-binding forkhead associated (FHA) protein